MSIPGGWCKYEMRDMILDLMKMLSEYYWRKGWYVKVDYLNSESNAIY